MTRVRALLAEALRSTARHRLVSGTLLLIAAVTTGSVLLTTGNGYAVEAAVIGSLDDTGSRVVVGYDQDGAAGIGAATVDALSRTDAAAWVLGLGTAVDHRVDPHVARGAVAVRPVHGDLADAVVLTSGRQPLPGEAVIGARAAVASGLVDGVGGLRAGAADVPVVGVFRAEGPLDRLNDVALAVPDGTVADQPLRYVYGLAPTIAQVDVLADALRAATVAADPDLVRLETPSAAVDLQRVISGELGSASRRATTLILVTSGILIVTVGTMVVGTRRRDVGRWRALGASRSAVVAGFLVQVLVPVLVGASAGAVSGQAWNHVVHEFRNSWAFAGALVVDAVLVAAVAAAVPALAAAHRDPVRVLRVP